MKVKTPTARAARQGLEMSNRSPALDVSDPTFFALENQRHSPIDWLAHRARVAVPTARLFAELHNFGGANA